MPWSIPCLNLKVKLNLLIFILFSTFLATITTALYYHIDHLYAKRKKEATQIIWMSIFICIIFLIIGSLFSITLIDIVIRPLIQARHVAKTIAKGDFSKHTLYHSILNSA